ncbi:MAG: class I tRNA ligase family protein, partial [Bacilli bacterium]|nr:class I tRNA ligase family protein [Bacilli bacterium]
QLWWGHRIPAWYKGDEVYVGMTAPTEEGWVQDEDVLDTWFSSALWPFSTLGWPNNTEDFERYYPNNVLVTAYDIILFWVNRMVFQGLEFTKERPFKDVLIHGLIRDKEGRKMSKSLGNGIDPMDVIEDYGADALRFYLTTNAAAGTDLKFDIDKVKSTWNFINKLWNASRYVIMNTEDYNYTLENLSLSDKWILTKLNNTIKEVTKNMENYDFNLVGSDLYSFIWNDFCDWYIELSKINMNDTSKSVLIYTLKSILKMLHPFMPFVTEEIYTKISDEPTIMKSKYPEYDKKLVFNESKHMDNIIELITKIRRAKLENNIKQLYLDYNNKILEENKDILDKLTKAEYTNNYNGLDSIKINFEEDTVIIYYDGSINKTLELENLYKEKERLEISIQRREKLLSNENYVNKAPKEIVENEKTTLEKEKKELEIINEKLN